jgi:hypothetical protein
MFDRPTFSLLIAYAFFPNLAAIAFVRWLGVDALAYITVIFVGLGTWYAIGIQLAAELDNYKRLNRSDVQNKSQAYRNEPRPIPNLNKPILENATSLVKIDAMGIKIKRCCRTLINQRESGFKIDLREETWKSQFGGRDNFVHFRDVIMSRAFAKESGRKNSPFLVVDWEEIQRGANGEIKH